MFGIDFPELVVIAVVALIVIGPEHLPKVARTMGHLWGRAQRYVNGVKSDISRDMALEELRQMQQKMQQEAGSLEKSVSQTSQEMEQQIKELEGDATKSVASREILTPHQMAKHEIIEEPQYLSRSELEPEPVQKSKTST